MSNSLKKIAGVGLSVTTAVWLSSLVVALPASAATTAELQAQIQQLLAQITQLQSQLSTMSGGAGVAVSCAFTRNLYLGVSGDDVKCLQQYLNASGNKVAESGAGSSGNETVYFGSRTKAAVAAWQSANGVSPAVGYFGSISQSKYSQLAATGTGTGTGTGTTPTTGLTLALASDNPASAVLPKGASAISVLKFTVSGSGTLTDLTFKRKGVGATADFASAGFYLYEGATRLTSGKSLNSTTHEVSFVNLGLAVSGTRTLSLVADVATGATSGNVSYFELVSSAGTPTPSGSLASNSMTIGGQSAGVATTTKVGSLSSSTVGATNVQISEFRLDVSGDEDIEVNSIAMTQGGSISNSNLSNFVLKQNDVTLATASGVGAKDLITFSLGSPFKIEKGQQKTFKVYTDVSGSAKSGDQIKLYFDSASDVKAKGKTYGFNVRIDTSGMDTSSEAHTVELKGGDVTITFNGPISGDIALRGQDVEVFNFTIATKSAIEIRNWRFHATSSGLTSGEGFNDLKVWDLTSNSVITSAVDHTTSTDHTLTDVYTMAAGVSRTFKVTVDVDPDNDDNDSIQASLLAFQSSDIKNTDNNQFVATSAIVPNSTISGNTMTVKAPSLDIQLSSNPSSQTYVRGSTGKSLVAFSFKATADTIKVSSVKVTASATSGTLTSGEVTNLALYDESGTKVSEEKSLNSSDNTATFDNLNVSINSGSTKTLTVKGNIATDATNGDIFAVKIASSTTDVTATDSAGNTATQTGFGTNSAATVAVTIADVGDITVVKAADDSETEAGIMLAGSERVLGKFRFTATNEDMTVNKLHILVASSNVAVANSDGGTVVDDVPTIKLYEGSTQIGATSGYTVNSSGASTSIAEISSLNWKVLRDSNKTLTVKGVVSSIGQSGSGADFGTSAWTSVMAAGFEAQGATAKDTSITAATGNEKLIYKTAPNFTSVAKPSTDAKLTAGTIPILKFKIKADGPDQISWKQIQFKVTVTQASMSAVEAAPGTTVGNVGLRDITGGGSTQLNIASAFSGTSTTTGEQVALGSAGGQTGYISLLLNAENTISAGSEKEYELSLNFTGISSTVGASTFVVRVHQTETSKFTGTVTGVRASIGTTTDAAPSFVWSDYSVAGHSDTEGPTATSSADWANSYLLKGIPSNTVTLSN
ncbi:MAG: peptidoglycan-binding domain-containing protein [Patescibacteria group bacterium]